MKSNFKKLSVLTSILVLSALGIAGVAASYKGENFVDVTSMNDSYKGNEKESTEVYPEVKFLNTTTHSALASTIEEDGEHLYGWGWSKDGQLGPGYTIAYENVTPVQIMFDDWESDWEFLDIENHYKNSMVLVEDSNGEKHVYAWGQNSLPPWGGGLNFSLIYGYPAETISTPVELDLSFIPEDESITGIELSGEAAYILTEGYETDHIYSWGSNSWGATGSGLTEGNVETPTEISIPGVTNYRIDDIYGGGMSANGPDYIYYVPQILLEIDNLDKNASEVYYWGAESYGSAGIDGDPENGTARIFYEPTLLRGGYTGNVKEIWIGRETKSAIYENADGVDSLWQWGKNLNGNIIGAPIGEKVLNQTMTMTTEGTEYDTLSDVRIGDENGFIKASNSKTGKSDFYGWGKNSNNVLLQEPSQTGEVLQPVLIDTSSFTDGNVGYINTDGQAALAFVNEQDEPGQLYTWGAGLILGRENTIEEIDGYEVSIPEKLVFNEAPEINDKPFPWWIVLTSLTVIGIIIILLMLWEIHLDHGEKHEHHWLHIGRHHE